MVIQMQRRYENPSTVILFEIVKGTTACSSTVFYGLLAWANLHALNPSKAETTRVTGQRGHRLPLEAGTIEGGN
jgi:hypothetical protein